MSKVGSTYPLNGNISIIQINPLDVTITSDTKPGYVPKKKPLMPWGREIAKNFSNWRSSGIAIEYKPRVTEMVTGSSSSVIPQVNMCVEYDVEAEAMTTVDQMTQVEGNIQGKWSDTMICRVNCDSKKTTGLTHFDMQPSSKDERWRRPAAVYITIDGLNDQMVADKVIFAEIWVTYNLQLSRPTAPRTMPTFSHWAATVGVATTDYFGSTGDLENAPDSDDLGAVFATDSITFPKNMKGTYVLLYEVFGDSTASLAAPGIAASSGASELSIVSDSSVYYPYMTMTGTLTSATLVINNFFTLDGTEGQKLTFSGGTFPASIDRMDLFIISCVNRNGEPIDNQ
jgi:hypothetical protein